MAGPQGGPREDSDNLPSPAEDEGPDETIFWTVTPWTWCGGMVSRAPRSQPPERPPTR
jgi:hypothetical protein